MPHRLFNADMRRRTGGYHGARGLWRRRHLVALLSVALLGVVWSAADAEHVEEAAFVYDSKEHRDPFVALVRDGRLIGIEITSVASAAPVLYGILWDPGGASIALINDLEVNEGDTVGGYYVEEIRPDAVVLARDGGERVVLELAFGTIGSPNRSTP